jgi:hypothetical protein
VKRSVQRAWTALAICAFIVVGQLAISAEASPNRPDLYPSTNKAVCEQGYGGSFTTSTDLRKCLVGSDKGATLYAGFGADGFDWVQTTKFGPDGASGEVQLGPATVGCSKPHTDTADDWAVDCM